MPQQRDCDEGVGHSIIDLELHCSPEAGSRNFRYTQIALQLLVLVLVEMEVLCLLSIKDGNGVIPVEHLMNEIESEGPREPRTLKELLKP